MFRIDHVRGHLRVKLSWLLRILALARLLNTADSGIAVLTVVTQMKIKFLLSVLVMIASASMVK